MIRTATGDVAAIAGRILAHEHLQIDLSAQKGPNNVIGKAEELDVIDDLRKAKEHGLAAIVDLSAPGWGRDPVALRRISQQAGIAVVADGRQGERRLVPIPNVEPTSSNKAALR